MFTSEVKNGEVYVFYLGQLIYKRWFHTSGDVMKKDYSIILDPYGPVTKLPKQGEM